MPRARRKSSVLETARERLNGLKTITPKPNLGPNLSPDDFEATVNGFVSRLDTYNQHLADLDQEQNELEAAEAQLREQNRRILSAVEAQFGPDSSQYEKVGGKRQSERKRRTGTKKPGGGTPSTPTP